MLSIYLDTVVVALLLRALSFWREYEYLKDIKFKSELALCLLTCFIPIFNIFSMFVFAYLIICDEDTFKDFITTVNDAKYIDWDKINNYNEF